MSVKIDASAIGITKPIEVATSMRAVRAAVVFQRDALKAEQGEDSEDPIESANAALAVFDGVAQYIVDTLKLTDKQADKIQDADLNDVIELAQQIAVRILHADNATPTEDDQKSK